MGFQTPTLVKNTSKETLKCHFVHLGPSGPPAATRISGVFQPTQIVKIRVRNPSNPFWALGSSGPASRIYGVFGFQRLTRGL
ncbi:Hypothetical protein FKW44_002838 [Caligus rogercresseyi]|uniref:Uncharacterized protein n=1 Tax=Caligus rogercresseyi TaxID=217165 RepID=A0A7T8KKR0_CALRO|nr:Hypothetical protein FKW44_002838 [Caligus rogercresseyi]